MGLAAPSLKDLPSEVDWTGISLHCDPSRKDVSSIDFTLSLVYSRLPLMRYLRNQFNAKISITRSLFSV